MAEIPPDPGPILLLRESITMETNDLFKRIREKDQAAFKELTEDYGWKLYGRIRKTTDDRDKADLIFKQTFSRFYNTMENYDCEDAIEAMLCVYAAMVTEELAQSEGETVMPELTGKKKTAKKAKKAHSGIANFFYVLGVLLLLAGIAAALWIMAGLLMDLQILPQFDLGYEWFNANIAPWF